MEQFKQRYAPGRRKNSFFIDESDAEKERKKGSETSENVFGYTYYLDSDGSMLKEKIR